MISIIVFLTFSIFSILIFIQTSIPVPSSVSGVIEELLVADGDTVTAGTDLCKIRITGKRED